MYFCGKEKRDSGNWWKTCGMRDSSEKGAGMRDQDPPFQTLSEVWCIASYLVFYLCLSGGGAYLLRALWVSLAFLVLTEKPNHSRPQISASLLLLFRVLPWLWWTLTSQGSVLSTRSRDTTYCALKSLIFLQGHQDEYLPCEKDGLHLTWGCIPFFGSTWHEKTFMIPPPPH